MPFDLGAVVPLATTVRDAAGALANAGAMQLHLSLPDSTTTTVAVAPASTGTYTYDYPSVQAGRHTVRWLATGINAGAYTDVFDVREATPPAILSLADAKKHLNKIGTTDDDEVRFWVEATTRAVEWFVGPVVVRTVTEMHDRPWARQIALLQAPVLAVTALNAVRSGGTSYTVDEFDVDNETGIVSRLDGGRIHGPLRITYTAGRRIIPAHFSAAARIILQHLWRTQQGPGRPQMGTDDYSVTEPIPGLGYAIPNRALQLLDPDRLPPGIA
ncbi:hypothetical protein [Streptomyces sp. NPDC002994]|uniref:hypothetical protein n=1 Tax=Streptomyces sp. NPDC002994 TaxID=3154441 RepID=UPI0033A1C932